MKKYVIVIIFELESDNTEEVVILLSEGEDKHEAYKQTLTREESLCLFIDGYHIKEWHSKELLK